jgi:hypothetical protein
MAQERVTSFIQALKERNKERDSIRPYRAPSALKNFSQNLNLGRCPSVSYLYAFGALRTLLRNRALDLIIDNPED